MLYHYRCNDLNLHLASPEICSRRSSLCAASSKLFFLGGSRFCWTLLQRTCLRANAPTTTAHEIPPTGPIVLSSGFPLPSSSLVFSLLLDSSRRHCTVNGSPSLTVTSPGLPEPSFGVGNHKLRTLFKQSSTLQPFPTLEPRIVPKFN